MMLRPYGVDLSIVSISAREMAGTGVAKDTAEREKRIEVLQHLRQKWGKTRRDLHPRTLLQAMGRLDVVTKEYVRAIVEAEYDYPVVSLYLSLNAEKVAPERKAWLRVFHEMKTQALAERKDYVDTLSRSQRFALEHDLKEIEEFLKEQFEPVNLRSLVIFRSAEELNRAIKLEVRTTDSLTIDPDPYVMPLEVVLEENEKVLFVEVEKEDSRFLIYQLGLSQQVERVQSFVPTDTVDKSIPGHAQRHRLTHLEWHLKHTASAAYRLYNEHRSDVVVLLAERRVSALLEEFLHDTVRQRIIGRIDNAPEAEPRDRRELIESALRAYRAKKETKAIEELQEHKPEEVVGTLRGVIAACNVFLVRRLLASEGLREKGFVCRGHHYVSLEATECPFDGEKLRPVTNVVDEIVEITRFHGVSVMVVEHRQEMLERYGGIAGVLYPGSTLTAVVESALESGSGR